MFEEVSSIGSNDIRERHERDSRIEVMMNHSYRFTKSANAESNTISNVETKTFHIFIHKMSLFQIFWPQQVSKKLGHRQKKD